MPWVCAGMGTELGQPCVPMSQERWLLPVLSLAVPVPVPRCCWLQPSLLPAAFWHSCFLAELLPAYISARGSPLPLHHSLVTPKAPPALPASLKSSATPDSAVTANLGLISCRRLNCLFDRTNKIAAVLNGWFHMWNLIGMTDTSFHLHTHKKIRGLRLSSTNLFP